MKWNENLPDPSDWLPKSDPETKQTLTQALRLTCGAAQQRIIQEAKIERSFNIYQFDSGVGLEDIVRRELRRLLPSRYDVSPGVLNDASGATVGDCDVLINNGMWAPVIKLGATEESRRIHFPIEAIYAIAEIKQTLTNRVLDRAMEKLVTAARLDRPNNPYGHITENQHLEYLDKEGNILNPLFSVILVAGISNRVKFDDLAYRFFAINRQLRRDEMVKMLCVLDRGVAYYSVRSKNTTSVSADFMRDRFQKLSETIYDENRSDCFYRFYTELLGHLTRSVLSVHELAGKYGGENPQVRYVTVDPSAEYVEPFH